MCFWALCHILSDSPLLKAVANEVRAGSKNNEPPSMKYLLEQCPLLDSVLHEVLRLYTSSASMRYIDEDTEIGGKILRKGNRIMLPYRTLHEDPEVYGHDSKTFRWDRFIKSPGLKRSSSYRPFGGGATLCAGRFLAQKEVLRLIGTALFRYDISLSQNTEGRRSSFPRVDDKKPTFGMMATSDGDDLEISIKKRI